MAFVTATTLGIAQGLVASRGRELKDLIEKDVDKMSAQETKELICCLAGLAAGYQEGAEILLKAAIKL